MCIITKESKWLLVVEQNTHYYELTGNGGLAVGIGIVVRGSGIDAGAGLHCDRVCP